jgi:hypothetical protein
VGIIYCQDNDVLSDDMDQSDVPDFKVNLSIDILSKSSHGVKLTDLMNSQKSEEFTCHECTNCTSKSELTSRVCQSGINMCYVSLFG